jgi:acetolactate decarboxylase
VPGLLSRLGLVSAAGAAIVLVATTPLAGASATAPQPTRWVTQAGTYDYLVQPDYDGLVRLRDVVGDTTIGLGTFDRLDGELVMIGGTTYRVGTDGVPRVVSLSRTTPFFEGVRFIAQASRSLPSGTECSSLLPLVDGLAGTSAGMVAVRIHGTFNVLTARSVPAQSQPYPPLADVVADQTVFPLTDVRATLVGFRTGNDLLGVGAPGLHLHGLTQDRSAGGHILGCTTGPDVRLSVHRTRGVRVTAAN